MRSLLALLITLIGFSCIVSCKKSNSSPGGSGGSVQGNWTFLYLTAQTQATTSVSGVTYVTKSSYTTTNNSGTIAFTADSAVITNLAYTANFTAVSYLYLGGALLDSASVPFSQALPATDESSAYKQIGNDSLYFPAGGFTSLSSGTTQATGARYLINKDTLKLSVQVSGDTSGVVAKGTETVYLLKQ